VNIDGAGEVGSPDAGGGRFEDLFLAFELETLQTTKNKSIANVDVANIVRLLVRIARGL